jgi:short subunit dehydrogenase-like uncharacterized protein
MIGFVACVVSLWTSSQCISREKPIVSQRSRHCVRQCSRPITANLAMETAPHRLLILGGTGRVGAKAADVLAATFPDMPLQITIAGRNVSRAERICSELRARHNGRGNITFEVAEVDTRNEAELAASIGRCDTVLHTAGPFQRRERPGEVLRAALLVGRNYVDVCDDVEHAQICKDMDVVAKEKGVSCWICTGIYPGISNLMAARCVAAEPELRASSVRFSYYTAGTGGIGSTVLASTFLLLSEDVTTYRGETGRLVIRPPASDVETIDFGGKVGKKDTYLLNLPETQSIHENLCDGEVVAKFATGPPIWNWLLRATARFVPRSLLKNSDLMRSFSSFSLPVVRAVDILSGARTAIRVDVDFACTGNENESRASVVSHYEHESLQECVGAATASFASEMITGAGSPGVYYPEEVAQAAPEIADSILTNTACTANVFTLPPVLQSLKVND